LDYPKLIEKLILILDKKVCKEIEDAVLSILTDFLKKFEAARNLIN
jgi:hypothetical protein